MGGPVGRSGGIRDQVSDRRNRFRRAIDRLIIDKVRSEELPVAIDESVPHA